MFAERAKRWRDRAEELRVIANVHISLETRAILLNCATDYDEMATRAERNQTEAMKKGA